MSHSSSPRGCSLPEVRWPPPHSSTPCPLSPSPGGHCPVAWGSQDMQPPSRATVSCLQGSAGPSLEAGAYFLVPLWSMVVVAVVL